MSIPTISDCRMSKTEEIRQLRAIVFEFEQLKANVNQKIEKLQQRISELERPSTTEVQLDDLNLGRISRGHFYDLAENCGGHSRGSSPTFIDTDTLTGLPYPAMSLLTLKAQYATVTDPKERDALQKQIRKLEVEAQQAHQKLVDQKLFYVQRSVRAYIDEVEAKVFAKIHDLEQKQSTSFSQIHDQLLQMSHIFQGEHHVNKKQALNLHQNYWDIAACHKDLEIIGPNRLTVRYKENLKGYWRSVLATFPIQTGRLSPTFCYFEITLIKMSQDQNSVNIGLAPKEMHLDRMVGHSPGSCAYEENPVISRGDVIGCGVKWATGQIILTKNGRRMDNGDLNIPSAANLQPLFPCVSLANFDDTIEGNFGPNFKFNWASVY